MASLFYFFMLGFFLTHELDGLKRREWRIMPVVSRLPEHIAEQIFIWVHVPLFALLFYFGAGDPASGVAMGLSVFAVIHMGLHWILRKHPNNEFNNVSSRTLIIGAGVLGVFHLIFV